MTYSFSYLEPVCCSMSSSNCCFLSCIQISQEADQVVGIPISFRIFQFIVIHTVKSFGIVNKAEIDIFMELLLFRWSSRCWQFDLWFLWVIFKSILYCWTFEAILKWALCLLEKHFHWKQPQPHVSFLKIQRTVMRKGLSKGNWGSQDKFCWSPLCSRIGCLSPFCTFEYCWELG